MMYATMTIGEKKKRILFLNKNSDFYGIIRTVKLCKNVKQNFERKSRKSVIDSSI